MVSDSQVVFGCLGMVAVISLIAYMIIKFNKGDN